MDRDRMRIMRVSAVVTVLALVSAACGSTVQVGGEQADGQEVTLGEPGQDELELDLGATDAPGEPGGELDGFDGPGATGGEAGGGATTPGTSGAPGGGAAAPGQPAPAPGTGQASTQGPARGLTDTEIFVGFAYTIDGANEALGVEGITTGDMRGRYQVLLDYFNARGGAGGRDIVPVYHGYDGTSTQSFSAQEQAGCATYTQDNEVFVVTEAGTEFSDGTMLACLHNAGVPSLNSPGTSQQSDAVYARFPNFVTTNVLSLDTIARMWPRGMEETGFFEPRSVTEPVRIGLLTYDTPSMRGVTEQSLKPAMRAVGQEFDEEAYISRPSRLADVGSMTTQINSALLRFRSAQVQHVMIQDIGNALLTLLFMQGAEGQGYRPRYGLTSNNGGQLLVDEGGNAAQFADARMIGWLPHFDVPEREFTESMGPARELCERIYAEAGVAFENRNARAVAYLQCDELFSLTAALNAMEGAVTQDKLIPTFVGLGTSWQSALNGPTRFAPDRRYGVSRYRLARFVDDCTCFRYTSGWRQVP